MKRKKSPYRKTDSHAYLYGNLGYVYLLAAHSNRQQQNPVEPWVIKSIDAYRQTINTIKPIPFAYAGLADNQVLLAEIEFENGHNIDEIIVEATMQVNQSLAISSEFYWPILTQGNIEKLKSRVALNKGQDPLPFIKKGHKYFKKSLSLNNKYAPTHVFQAELYYLQMENSTEKWQQQKSFDNAINAALAIDQDIVEAWLLQAKFLKFAQDNKINSQSVVLNYQELLDKTNAINPLVLLGI